MKSLPMSLIALVAGGCTSSLQTDLEVAKAEIEDLKTRLAFMEAALGVDPEADAPTAVHLDDLRSDVDDLVAEVDPGSTGLADSRLDVVDAVLTSAPSTAVGSRLDESEEAYDALYDEVIVGTSLASRLDELPLESTLSDLDDRVEVLETALTLEPSGEPGSWVTWMTEVFDDLHGEVVGPDTSMASRIDGLAASASVLALQQNVTELNGVVQSTASGLGDVEDLWIRDDLTLTVVPTGTTPTATQFATPNAAFEYLADKVIVSPAEVTVQLLAGSHQMTRSLLVNHANADRILLRGAGSGAGGTLVRHEGGNSNAFVIDANLGLLDQMAITGDTISAIYVPNGGTLRANDVKITDFIYGIFVEGGRANLESVTVESASGYGIYSGFGGAVAARGVTVLGPSDVGIYVENASFDARPISGTSPGVTIRNAGSGLVCSEGASCSTEYAVITGNSGDGVTSQYGSTVTALHGQGITGNTGHEYYFWAGSYIAALASSGSNLTTEYNLNAPRVWSSNPANSGYNGFMWYP